MLQALPARFKQVRFLALIGGGLLVVTSAIVIVMKAGAVPDVKWVRISGGTFIMGGPPVPGRENEGPEHEVKVPSFSMLQREVTVEQYARCVDAGACWTNPGPQSAGCNWGKRDRNKYPMNCLDWYQAAMFCQWLGGRLPSEAEWEYAARSGGKNIVYAWGDDAVTCERATIDEPPGLSCGSSKGTTSIGCTKPNGNSAQGLCDLAGNVVEWVRDWYRPDYRSEEAPRILNERTRDIRFNRVMRGGGIGSSEEPRARNRIHHSPEFQFVGSGVRCAR